MRSTEYPEARFERCEFCLKKECLFIYTAHEYPDRWGDRNFDYSCDAQIEKFHRNYTFYALHLPQRCIDEGAPTPEEQNVIIENKIKAHILEVEESLSEKALKND